MHGRLVGLETFGCGSVSLLHGCLDLAHVNFEITELPDEWLVHEEANVLDVVESALVCLSLLGLLAVVWLSWVDPL